MFSLEQINFFFSVSYVYISVSNMHFVKKNLSIIDYESKHRNVFFFDLILLMSEKKKWKMRYLKFLFLSSFFGYSIKNKGKIRKSLCCIYYEKWKVWAVEHIVISYQVQYSKVLVHFIDIIISKFILRSK